MLGAFLLCRVLSRDRKRAESDRKRLAQGDDATDDRQPEEPVSSHGRGERSRERTQDECRPSFELRIAAAVWAATFPPETTTATEEPSSSGTFPATSAARPTAPAGSHASFARA